MWELTNGEFTELMQQYQRLIYTVCLQFVHDPHTAEDLTQYAEDNDLLVAKHILLLTKDMTTGEDLSDAEKAEKKAKADELLQQWMDEAQVETTDLYSTITYENVYDYLPQDVQTLVTRPGEASE